MSKRLFITGISGCIGHYLADLLIAQTDYELFLLVRNPAKLQFDPQARPGIHLLIGDMDHLEPYQDLLKTIDVAVLIATSWGDPEETYRTNVTQTLALLNSLDSDRCEQVIYFSTASILNRQGQALPEAGELGTDYIRTKYLCHQALKDLALYPKITTVYPTFVFGGETHKPYSHLSGGLGDILRWLNLIRWFTADGSFHFIHGRDIAQVVTYLIAHPLSPTQYRDVVLGNATLTVQETITQICRYFHKTIYFQIPLSVTLANFFIKAFRLQLAPWDRFCMEYRHFTYANPVNPATLGLTPYCATIAELLKVHDL